MRASALLALPLVASGCGFDDLRTLTDPVPDAGAPYVRPDPGGPEPGPLEQCGRGGSAAYVEGDAGGRVFSGVARLEGGRWDATGSPSDAASSVAISYATSAAGGAPDWRFEFSTRPLGELLRPFTFDDAEKLPGTAGHPAMNVSAGLGCAKIVGRFRVHELALAGSKVKAFTATFEQRCTNETAGLRGCVRFAADPL